MNLAEFMERFNERAAAIGHEVRIQEVMNDDAHASALFCSDEVAIVAGEREDVTYCQVICGMNEGGALLGLCAYATALDVLTGCTEQVRKGWLGRLGLFNGRLKQAGEKGTATVARDFVLSVRIHNPGKNLMSYIIRKNAPAAARKVGEEADDGALAPATHNTSS